MAVTIVESAEQARASNARERKEDEHDANDLEAQVRAANAAEKQLLPTWLGAILSFVGTVLIVVTLFLTREANKITSQALEISKRQADVSELSSKRQLRAYLYIELKEAPKLVLGCRPQGEFWLKNGGQTPAHNVRIVNALSIGKYPFEGDPPPLDESTFQGGTIRHPHAPSVIVCRTADEGITQRWIDAINEGSRRIVMYGEIRYEDIFGETHITKYRAEFGGPETIAGDRVVWSPFGNTAT